MGFTPGHPYCDMCGAVARSHDELTQLSNSGPGGGAAEVCRACERQPILCPPSYPWPTPPAALAPLTAVPPLVVSACWNVCGRPRNVLVADSTRSKSHELAVEIMGLPGRAGDGNRYPHDQLGRLRVRRLRSAGAQVKPSCPLVRQ